MPPCPERYVAAVRTLHLCQFHFKDQDIRVVGSEIDGGTSINGSSETIAIDGGGFWQADFANATFGGRGNERRAETLSWRAMNAGLSGGVAASILFCDSYHQPINATTTVPHDDGTPFDDGTEYLQAGADAEVVAVVNGQSGGLNATIIDISITSDRPLIGGERATYVHPTWGDRAFEIKSVVDNGDGTKRVSFQPPIRGGIAVGDSLDFSNPRCQMRRISQPTNALNLGIFSSASITFVEDMRDPDA